MERERRKGNHLECGYGFDNQVDIDKRSNYGSPSMAKIYPVSSPPSFSPSLSPCPSPSSFSAGNGGHVSFIEHHVSKMDTLAGVAIKYGVEVADIKRLNGLVTDLQMFALKSLHIPLPGRHPPSPGLSNGSVPSGSCSYGKPPSCHAGLLEPFQSLRVKSTPRKVSPAMSSLQGYYGLNPKDKKVRSDGCEMAIYGRDDGPFPRRHSPVGLHRKSRSLANGFMAENGGLIEETPTSEAVEGDSAEKGIRRRQKSEADFNSFAPEKLLRDDGTWSGGGYSTIAGKGLALRNKGCGRNALAADVELGRPSAAPAGPGDDGYGYGVRKSSSTSNLQDPDNSGSSIWPMASKWSLKPDLQTLSNASSITRPIFDGLPKPITGRRNKAALD